MVIQDAPASPHTTPLTRRDLYQLAEHCRDYARELAQYDQHRVNLPQCHRFNAWLPQLKGYDRLAPYLRTLRPAWPVARWQVLTLAVIIVAILTFMLPTWAGRRLSPYTIYGYSALLFLLYLLPEHFYGTTIELIEGKVLRVVDALDQLLQQGDLGFSEAAFHQVKANLEAARRELRQQIDLAHRA